MKSKIRWTGSKQARAEHFQAVKEAKKKKKEREKNKKQSTQKHYKSQSRIEKPEYYSYMKSKRWERKRSKFIKRAGKKCMICGTSNVKLDVHHKHYNSLGNERFKDIEVLCRYCHESKHEQNGVTQTDPVSIEFREIMR